MAPDERERLARLEARQDFLDDRIDKLEKLLGDAVAQIALLNNLLQQGRGIALLVRIAFAVGGVGLIIQVADYFLKLRH